MYSNKKNAQIFSSLLLAFASASASAGFTYNEIWEIPSMEQCDQYGYVTYRKQAAGVLSLRESKKIIVPVPEGAMDVFFTVKSHSSEPSILFSKTNYNAVCYASADQCPDDQVTALNNGLGDSLEPRYGANPEKRFTLSDEENLFIYSLNKEDPLNPGYTANEGAADMFAAIVSFQLTQEACDIRAGVTPQEIVDDIPLVDDTPIPVEPVINNDVVVMIDGQAYVTYSDYQKALAPVIYNHKSRSFHLNQLYVGPESYAIDLELLTEKTAFEQLGGLSKSDSNDALNSEGRLYFSLDAQLAYSVSGLTEDHDDDGVSLIEGDCNDNDDTVYPGANEAGSDRDLNCNID